VCAAFRAAPDGGALYVRATPGARKSEIGGLWRGPSGEERLAVRVAAPPDAGRANDALIELLAGVLGIAKSRLTLAAGASQRLKTVAIAGDSADIARRVEDLLASAGSKAP